MVIRNHIYAELFKSTAVVVLVIMLIVISVRFNVYLEQAVSGDIDAGAIGIILFLRMPEFLALIVPIGFGLAQVMVFGRMHSNGEMYAIESAGIGPATIAGWVMVAGLLLSLLVSSLTLWVAPTTGALAQLTLQEGSKKARTFAPQEQVFSRIPKSSNYLYVHEKSGEGIWRDVLLISSDEDRLQLTRAGSMQLSQDGLTLSKGVAYLFEKDAVRGEVLFERFAIPVEARKKRKKGKMNTVPTRDLLTMDTAPARAELQWRLAPVLMIPLSVPIVLLIARVPPRKTPLLRVFPAFIVQVGYLSLLSLLQSQVTKGSLAPEIGLWAGHALIVLVGAVLWRSYGWRWSLLLAALVMTMGQLI